MSSAVGGVAHVRRVQQLYKRSLKVQPDAPPLCSTRPQHPRHLCCARAHLAGRRAIFPTPRHAHRRLRAPPQLLLDWTVHRELWIDEGFKMRARFDANKDLKDPVQIQKVLAEGEAELWEFRHPDPYVLNHMPGGTKYQRYPRNGAGLPPEVCALPSYLK